MKKWETLLKWEQKYKTIVISTLTPYDLRTLVSTVYMSDEEALEAIDKAQAYPDIVILITELENRILEKAAEFVCKEARAHVEGKAPEVIIK